MPGLSEQGVGPAVGRSGVDPLAGGLALAVLMAFGLGYRVLTAGISANLGRPVMPRRALSTIPQKLGQWEGREVALDEDVSRVAHEDDFVNREYLHPGLARAARVYIGYIGRPRARVHRPDVCYPVHGYQRISERSFQVELGTGAVVPARLYEFRSPAMGGRREWVVALYVVNGQYLSDFSRVNDYNARSPTLLGERGPYVARVQVSVEASADETADLLVLSDLAAELIGPVSALMPYMAEGS